MLTVGLTTYIIEGSAGLSCSRLSGSNANSADRGQPESGLRLTNMSADNEYIEDLNKVLNDRYTAEELCELLGLTLDDLFYKFLDEVLEVDWEEIL